MKDKVNILGTEYQIEQREYKNDKTFEKYHSDGYCDTNIKLIVIGKFETFPEDYYFDFMNAECINSVAVHAKHVARHEIVHAFLSESGLSGNTKGCNAWAKNEEMIDWIASQGLKIYAAWQEAGAL